MVGESENRSTQLWANKHEPAFRCVNRKVYGRLCFNEEKALAADGVSAFSCERNKAIEVWQVSKLIRTCVLYQHILENGRLK